MLFALDIGNTQTVIGLLEGREVRHHWRLSTETHRTPDEITIQLDHLLRLSGVDVGAIDAEVMITVVPALRETWQAVIERVLGRAPLIVTAQTPLPIALAVDYPEQVGTDRIANAVGGRARRGAPVLVVDFGTATTIDVVGPEGAYRGGVILPGPEIAAEALFQKTAALPRVALRRPERVIGTNTIAAMHSGLFHGFLGSVERLIDEVRGELGAPDCPVLSTGGLGTVIAPETRRVTEHVPWLTLEGLVAIWEHVQSVR